MSKENKVIATNVNYMTGFELQKLEVGGVTKHILKGKLMDDSMNKNHWKAKTEDLPKLATQVKGTPLKIQHSNSDWDIVGSGVKGKSEGNMIYYAYEVTDSKAKQKFEEGTWTAENMGISPGIGYDKITCSVCGQDVELFHKHIKGEKYDGKVCFYEIINPTLVEASLTSAPAYNPSAGTIDTVTLGAELDNLLKTEKGEETMAKETSTSDFEILLADKDKKNEDLTAQMTTIKAELDTKDTEIKELKTKVDSSTVELNKYVRASRKSELESRLEGEGLINEILEKDLSDADFKAEVARIDKIQAQTKTNANKGSATAEDGKTKEQFLAEAEDRIGEEMFGTHWKDVNEKGGAE